MTFCMMVKLIFIVIILFLLYLFSRLRPAATQIIEENIYAVRCGFVNFYAVRTSAGILLFDSGASPAMAKRGLHKLDISLSDVSHIFLTHTDIDHAGGIKAFPNAITNISIKEEKMIDGSTARRGPIYNRKISGYQTLEDSETVVIGDTAIELRLTPGHTAGSAIYIIGRDVFVTGDLLWYSRRGKIFPCIWYMNMDNKLEEQSAKAALDAVKDARLVLTGHTGIQIKSIVFMNVSS